ncbi:hypothetical protein DFQ29_003145 [Apophysomyces sp. BC1021]|nr:hypothetical protein DFQ29_003145 [Apophysomyces sp. BC1021]
MKRYQEKGQIKKDRTKLILEAKQMLDDVIVCNPSDDDMKDLTIQNMQIVGLFGEVVQLKLAANGLYVAETKPYMKIKIPGGPTRLEQFRSSLASLLMFRENAIKVSQTIRTAKADGANSPFTDTYGREKPIPTSQIKSSWTRDSWTPPSTPTKSIPPLPQHLYTA